MHRPLFLAGGLLSVALATLGLFLPLLPTTPFLLLAGWCFARSSQRLHRWLLGQRHFGPILRDWERHRAVRPRVKLVATILILAVASWPLLLLGLPWFARLGAAATIGAVLVFLWTRPAGPRRTRAEDSGPAPI